MKNMFLALPAVMLLTGCATSLENYKPTTRQISEPPINSINTANIGDKMLSQGRVTESEALYFATTQRTSFQHTIQQGYFPKKGESEEYVQYDISNSIGAGKVIDGALSDPTRALTLRKSDNAICMFTIYNMNVDCKTGLEFEKRNWATVGENSFQQTLIYNGKVGSKINIGYREFSDSMARSSFSNEVEYDLNDSKQIGYKGALLNIIDANNQMIKYKVLKNFNTQ
ncbi:MULTISPECIES: hypothetical protein [Psychrobacter]|uniref:hypothetical protein n=1 Tax=Psychrobacter TaxID=497 RepID=UPI000C34113A|nr:MULTISPECIES: hypothetical protein [Psychrobacter]MBA6244202.1 hypothetical protein [Psychrobacter sp. Urea-trap-18]MBA6285288.1 hypothetical protein [Psychrobacter sp. Urea-trap-16]MBA6319141.1 hypothetical protein [Psychrobacter sp. Urea-trap-20]MBA6333875.1 hypothetical protein [Psychrobacter sp. Urea-trap-19]PKG60261.1 hypothetical protein CXF63_08960 [Psychrobacter sp. Choline-3u-12]